jgi:hypothetical protein
VPNKISSGIILVGEKVRESDKKRGSFSFPIIGQQTNKRQTRGQTWWYTPAIPATQELEGGESRFEANWTKLV